MRWISEWLFKEHIEQIVEDKFQEKLLETYLYTRKQELQQRIEKVRSTLDTQAHGIHENKKTREVLPSSELRRKNEEPRVQTQASQTGIDDIKAKLLGKMKQ
jgi:hypothetical protein